MATVTTSFTSDATILEIRSKAPEYMKKASELIHQNRTMIALMRKWGKIKHSDISWATAWNAVTKLPQVREWSDDVLPMFQPGPNPIQFNLGDGSYEADDKFTRMQYLRLNGGRLQIQNYYKDKSKYLAIAMGQKLNFEFIHGTGLARRLTGLDTVVTLSGGTNIAADVVAVPGAAATYAGQTLRPGARGGSWPATLAVKPNANLATDWPILGNQTTYDPERTDYDATSPLNLNTTSTSWASGSTWAENAEEVMRYYLGVNTQRGGMVSDPTSPTVFLMGEKRMRELKTLFSAKNYALLPIPEGMDYGMPDTFKFEGAWFRTDSDVGSDMAYAIQPDMMEYRTPQEDLWETHGPDWKMQYTAYLYLLLSIGLFRLEPKFFGSLQDVA